MPKPNITQLRKIMQDASKKGSKIQAFKGGSSMGKRGMQGTQWSELKHSKLKQLANTNSKNHSIAIVLDLVLSAARRGDISPPEGNGSEQQTLTRIVNKVLTAEKSKQVAKLTALEQKTLSYYENLI